MDIKDKVIVVTGGANGIGKAMCLRFAADGAAGVVVADLDVAAAQAVADQIGGLAVACDVSDEAQIQNLVAQTEQRFGRVDIFCSNAGVGFGDGDSGVASATNEQWLLNWNVNVMAHVLAARAVLPGMLERGEGYLVNTASAAGLLNQVGDAAYSTTKHAAIGFAEAIAITHGDKGIRVSVVCPQYVATHMTGIEEGEDISDKIGFISPADAAGSIIEGIRDERFLILTHPEVETYRQRKSQDYDRWLSGMQRLRKNLLGDQLSLNVKKLGDMS
ncbi:MAG: SDR family oxidoreductase [Pseudomonadales bacterium]